MNYWAVAFVITALLGLFILGAREQWRDRVDRRVIRRFEQSRIRTATRREIHVREHREWEEEFNA